MVVQGSSRDPREKKLLLKTASGADTLYFIPWSFLADIKLFSLKVVSLPVSDYHVAMTVKFVSASLYEASIDGGVAFPVGNFNKLHVVPQIHAAPVGSHYRQTLCATYTEVPEAAPLALVHSPLFDQCSILHCRPRRFCPSFTNAIHARHTMCAARENVAISRRLQAASL